jgi:hypothetical protein
MTIQLTNDGAGDVETILERALDPAALANTGKIYTKDVATVTELFYRASDGTVSQLTPATAPGDTPWTRSGTDVRLDQTGDTEVTPFDDNATTFGLQSTVALTRRWLTVITGSNGLWTYNAAGDANRSSFFGNAGLAWGLGGGSALDAGMQRGGVARITVSSGDALGAGGLFPLVDGTLTALLGDSTLRWRSVSANRHDVFAGAGFANPAARLSRGTLELGDLTLDVAPDIRFQRTAAVTLQLDDGLGGAINVLPFAGSIQGSFGSSAAIFQSFGGNQFDVWNAIGDANPAARLTVAAGGSLRLGPGGATAEDVYIKRTAATELTLSNAAASAGIDVIPPAVVNGTGRLGTTTNKWAEVNAFTVTTGDVVFTDPGCPVCGQEFAEGDDLVMRVIKTSRAPDGGPLTRTVPCHHGCK